MQCQSPEPSNGDVPCARRIMYRYCPLKHEIIIPSHCNILCYYSSEHNMYAYFLIYLHSSEVGPAAPEPRWRRRSARSNRHQSHLTWPRWGRRRREWASSDGYQRLYDSARAKRATGRVSVECFRIEGGSVVGEVGKGWRGGGGPQAMNISDCAHDSTPAIQASGGVIGKFVYDKWMNKRGAIAMHFNQKATNPKVVF